MATIRTVSGAVLHVAEQLGTLRLLVDAGHSTLGLAATRVDLTPGDVEQLVDALVGWLKQIDPDAEPHGDRVDTGPGDYPEL